MPFILSFLHRVLALLALGTLTGCASFFKNVAETFENPWKKEVDNARMTVNEAVAKAYAVKDTPLDNFENAQAVYDNTYHCLDAVSDIKDLDEYEPETRTLRSGQRSWPFSLKLGEDTVSVEEAYTFCATQMNALGETSLDACGLSGFVMEMNIYNGTAEAAKLKPDWNPRLDYFTEDDRTLDFEPISCTDMQEPTITPTARPYADRLHAICGENGIVWVPLGWREFEETSHHTVKVMDVRCYVRDHRQWYATEVQDALRTHK